MSDRDVVNKIQSFAHDATFQFEGDLCVYAKLNNKNNLFYGSIRTAKNKPEILSHISKLKNLRFLDLRKNRIHYLPNLDLHNLVHLDIASNYLCSVPNWIRNNKLTFLNLGVNNLKEIPEWISEFKDLTVLKLHKNELVDVSPIKTCTKVKFLNLYLNKMKKIPDFVWQFKDVEFFSWGLTGITHLPPNIGNWKNLTWLSLVANKLQSLPDDICKLTNLKGMRLNKNKIEKLPENIGLLKNLEELSLYRNCLKSLPESFAKLNLKKLNIAYNDFENIPLLKSEWLCDSKDKLKWS